MSVITRSGGSARDAEAVLALYDRLARELLGFFTRRTRDPQVALDLLSETFLAAFEHRDQCRAGSEREAAAWVYRIAANQLAAHYRRGAIERRATERLATALRAPTAAEVSAIERLAEGSGARSGLRRQWLRRPRRRLTRSGRPRSRVRLAGLPVSRGGPR